MKCPECSFEGEKSKYRYLYNARIDAPIALRQCPQCQVWLAVDELAGEVKQMVGPGEAPWGKSAGIEGLAQDAAH
jgi:Zn-finger nucleic acid-binding protein